MHASRTELALVKLASVDKINCFFSAFEFLCREFQENGRAAVCINIFARLNARATLIAARPTDGLPSNGHASPRAIFSYLRGDKRLAAQFDRRPSATDILKPLSVIGACRRPSRPPRRYTRGTFQCIRSIVGADLPR